MVENIHIRENELSSNRILASALRDWQRYVFTEDPGFLDRSLKTLASSQEKKVETDLCRIFLLMENNQTKLAASKSENLAAGRTYFKNTRHKVYATLTFLLGLTEIRRKNLRNYEKHAKALLELTETDDCYLYHLYYGALRLQSLHLKEAGTHFMLAYQLGCRSVLFYGCLKDFFEKVVDISHRLPLFRVYLKWGLAHKVNLEPAALRHRYSLLSDEFERSGLTYQLYRAYPWSWLLQNICEGIISSGDYSYRSYSFCLELEQRQLSIEGLHRYLLMGAFMNGLEKVSRYSIKKTLEHDEIEEELKLYAYHLLLINKKNKEFIREKKEEIIKLGTEALQNNRTGRYVNSIYKYLTEKAKKEITKEQYFKALTYLKNDVLSYEIRPASNKNMNIWIIEEETHSIQKYEYKGNPLKIKSITYPLKYVCRLEENGMIIKEKLCFKKLVEQQGINLYIRLLELENENKDLTIAIVNELLSEQSSGDRAVEYFKQALLLPNISRNFKTKLYLALGNILYIQGQHKSALEYFSLADDNNLNHSYTEHMLESYMEAEEFRSAVNIINNKTEFISDNLLYQCVRRLCLHDHFQPLLADRAYELLLKSMYDRRFVSTVIKYYQGSQRDWQLLSMTLDQIFEPDYQIDRNILSNSIRLHKPDEYSQLLFEKINEYYPDDEIVGQFAYYLIYEITVNNTPLTPGALSVLEEMFSRYKNSLTAYALSVYYLTNNIKTDISQEITEYTLNLVKEKGFYFPAFKKISDPYTQRFQPFIYRNLPNKDVFLHYNIKGKSNHSGKKYMKYFGFGIYLAQAECFYADEISYFFSEDNRKTEIQTVKNTKGSVRKAEEEYHKINNANIYQQILNYDRAEEELDDLLKEKPEPGGVLL